MKYIFLKTSRTDIVGVIFLLLILFHSPKLFAVVPPSPQRCIMIYTISDNHKDYAWPEGEEALIRELRRTGYDVRIHIGEFIISDSSHLPQNDINISQDTSVVQIVKPPNQSFAVINIWFIHPNLNKILHTSITGLETETQEAPVVAALKVNELVSVDLNKTDTTQKTPPIIPNGQTRTDTSRDTTRSNQLRFLIGLGMTSSFYLSNAPVRVGPVIEMAVRPTKLILLSLQMGTFILGKDLSKELYQEKLNAELRQYAMTLNIDFKLNTHRIVNPFIGLFVGGAFFKIQGFLNSAMQANETHTLTFTLGTQIGVVFTVARNISLVTRITGGAFLPPVEIMFGTKSVVECGPIYINATLAIRFHF